MKKITLSLLALLLTCTMWQINAQTFTGAGNPQAVPASGSGGACTPTTITTSAADASSLSGTIGTEYSIESVTLDITHTFDGDLDISLISPNGTTLDLSSDNGGSGNDFTNTTFQDGGSDVTAASAPFSGVYQPEGGTFAAAFAGDNVSGDWTLSICDDAGGDVGTLNDFTITFLSAIDPNAPIINCPADIMADSFPGECSAEVFFGDPVAIDPNGGSVTVTQTMGLPSGSDFPVGDTVVEFTATNDEAPNETTTCQFIVTVNDVEPPMMTCPDNIVVDNEAGLCGATVIYPDPIVMDNCFNSGVTTSSETLATIFDGGNGLGGGSAVYFDVTVAGTDIMVTSLDMNTDAPVGDPVTIEMYTRADSYAGNEQTMTGWNLVATATGTSAGTNNPTNVVLGSPVTLAAGSLNGVALVFDANSSSNYTNGNGANESFSNADLTIDLGSSNATPFSSTPFAPRVWNGAINYDVTMVTGSTPYTVIDGLASGDFFPVGTTTNTLEYTDAGGNTVQCSFDVTVNDVEAPVITCVGGPSFPTATSSMVDGQAITDSNPTTTSVMTVTDEFDITDLDVTLDITHTWVGDLDITLTSPAGTSVVIFDAGCSGDDLMFILDDEAAGDLADCTTGANPAYPDPAYVPSNPLSAFDGESTLGDWTLEVTDNFGGDDGTLNSWGITYEYEVAGTGGPTVVLDANGVGTIDTADFIDSATDNCGIASITVAGAGAPPPPVEECGDNIGATISSTNPTTLSTATVADTGLIGSDFAIQSVELDINHTFDGDLEMVLISPAGTTLDLSIGNGGSGDNFTDTVFADGGMDITAGSAPFTGTFEPEGGTFAATFDGEDISGDWVLSITDTFGGDDGVLNAYCINFENLNASQAFFGCEDIGTNTIDIVVTDESGNESVCTSTVTVVDETAPVLVCQDITVELDENGEASIEPEDLLAETPAVYDIMTIGSNNGSNAPGNTDFTVAITDAATVTFDWDYTTADIAGFDGFGYLLNGVFTELTNPAMGNQSGSGSVAVAPGDTFGFRSFTSDNGFGGNETVVSNFMPGYDGQFDQANWTLTLDNSDGDAFFVEAVPAGPLSFDACGIEVLAIDTDGMYTCEDVGMTFSVQVFASDASNNASVCTSMVTVADTMAPVITCPESAPAEIDPATGTYTFPDYFAEGLASAFDNCTEEANITTTQDPAPGFESGVTPNDPVTVTLTATDESGNTATCTFEVDVVVLGVEENELNAAITMYPNPANSEVTISNGSNLALERAVIYDTNGKLINTVDLRNMQSEQTINVSDLATGVYMIQISSERATIVKRLIKQ